MTNLFDKKILEIYLVRKLLFKYVLSKQKHQKRNDNEALHYW
jgi:hypothetical protein